MNGANRARDAHRTCLSASGFGSLDAFVPRMHTGLRSAGAHHVMGLPILFGPRHPLALGTLRTLLCTRCYHAAWPHSPAPRLGEAAPGPTRVSPFASIHRASWTSWASMLTRRANDTVGPQMDGQEEAAKAAILEKLMKGRQPTDLKLRCKS